MDTKSRGQRPSLRSPFLLHCPGHSIWISAGVDVSDDLQRLQVDDSNVIVRTARLVGTESVRRNKYAPEPRPVRIRLISLCVAASRITKSGPAETRTVSPSGVNLLETAPDGETVLRFRPADFVRSSTPPAPANQANRDEQGLEQHLVAPDGLRAYEACTPDNYVAVIDLKTLEVIGHIDAGGNPDGMAWAVE